MTDRMRIIVAQLGARRHYAVPRIFHEADLLERLFTDSYLGNKPWLEHALRLMPTWLRPAGASRLLGRREESIPPAKVTSFDGFGLRYARAQRRANGMAELARVYADFARRFCQRVVAATPPRADMIWGFNGAALELFRWAKERDVRCALEQTSGPKRLARALIAEELERWPGWQPALRLPPEPDPLAEREEEEWALADRIVAGSGFVVDAIDRIGGPAHKVVVVPYGVDLDRFAPDDRGRTVEGRRPLRVLFAGTVGLWKGAPYLLEALRQLGPDEVEARFAGTVALAPDKLAPYGRVATFLGPVPRLHMPELYRWADVLVLPSLSEGSAAVVYEALAAGVYVIATPNAGSVLSGVSPFGEIVPVRSAEAIAAALWHIRELGPDADQDAGSRPAVALEDYRDRLLHAARGLA